MDRLFRLFARENISRLIAIALVALAILALVLPANKALAQTPSNPAPYNVDLGALITNTLRTAGDVTTAAQNNTNWRGVVCTMVQTAVSGSPSTTFSIQGYDAATASYNTLATSSAVTTDTGANKYTVWISPGLIAADVPTNGVGKSTHLPRTWRLSQTVGGTAGPAMTGKIGCNYLL